MNTLPNQIRIFFPPLYLSLAASLLPWWNQSPSTPKQLLQNLHRLYPHVVATPIHIPLSPLPSPLPTLSATPFLIDMPSHLFRFPPPSRLAQVPLQEGRHFRPLPY